MHILSLQPYYGGSHRAFQQGWQRHSDHQWTILTLPPRHWKWRMRHAAVHFAERLADELSAATATFDAIFCSDFLNVAEFRGLTGRAVRRLPLTLYFHENQFAYPTRRHDERDLHFGFTNFTSCLAADQVWFNSAWNRDSFFAGLERAGRQWPDFPPLESIRSLTGRCQVEPPGIELPARKIGRTARSGPLRLVWAARWEHDKNPALLLDALRELDRKRVDFRISVIGESFRRVPGEFARLRQDFGERIDRWGFQESAADYALALQEADVFVSTADHEFFGIAAAEAVIHGAIPLLPDRLAYPELIRCPRHPQRKTLFLYDGSPASLAEKLEYISRLRNTETVQRPRRELQTELTDELGWPTRAPLMDRQIGGNGMSRSPDG